MRITFAQEARTEFAAAIRWYAKEAGPDQAKDFRSEVHLMLTLISEYPAIGAPTICGARHRVTEAVPVQHRVSLCGGFPDHSRNRQP